MSQTGKNKKLASFNCDQKMWEQFIARCKSKGTTATATLTQFIEHKIDDIDNLDAIGGNDLDKRLDSKIKASVEDYLVAGNNINASLTSETILAICSRLDKLESQRFARRIERWQIRKGAQSLFWQQGKIYWKRFFIPNDANHK